MPNEFRTIDVSEDIDPNRVDATWMDERRQLHRRRRQPDVNPLAASDDPPVAGRPQRELPQPGETPAPRLPPHRR
jgi:hypothetical protein